MAQKRQALKRGVDRALDVLLPPQCLACGTLVAGGSGGGVLCPSCWDGVSFLSAPWCDACGLPFEHEMEEGALCGACSRKPPAWRRARAAFAYEETTRRLLVSFKHGDRTDAAPAYGRWLLRAGVDLFDGNDLVAPVPLHWTRLLARRYNQAALLAREVARATGLELIPGLLRRTRRTASQGHLNPKRRRDNVRGAFAVVGGRRVEGRRVLLVDDVMTTGATAAACAKCLLKAGAEAVDVLTLARVVRPIHEKDR